MTSKSEMEEVAREASRGFHCGCNDETNICTCDSDLIKSITSAFRTYGEKRFQESRKEVSRLRNALECVYVWLANSQDHEKCKNNPFPDGIVKQALKNQKE